MHEGDVFFHKNPLEKAYFIFKLTGNGPAGQFWQIESALRLYLGKKNAWNKVLTG